MERIFENLPLYIQRYYDTRPEDSCVDPAISEEQSLLKQIFSPRQIEILAKLIEKARIDPTCFRVFTAHQYYEFGRLNRGYNYAASVTLGCEDPENKYQNLIVKQSHDHADYLAWRNPSSWIEEKDLPQEEQ